MNEKPSSRGALRRLLIVLAIAAGFVVYAYGWTVTDISLKPTQDQNRQNSMQRAMRELFSPDIFDQKTTSITADANFQKGCSGQPVQQPARETGKPYLQFSSDCGVKDDLVTVEGFDFPALSTGQVLLVRASGEPQPLSQPNGQTAVFDVDGHGHFSVQISVPNIRGDTGTIQPVRAQALIPEGLPYLSDTTQIVLQLMLETVLLALMATTLALPVSVFISFLAARNLMKPIKLPLGNILIGFVLLPLGWLIGSALLAPLGNLGIDLGKGIFGGVAAPVVSIVVFGAVSQFAGRINLEPNSLEARLRGVVIHVLFLAVAIFTVGAFGGICTGLGDRLNQGVLLYLGNILVTLGDLIKILMGFVAGLGGALLLSSMGMNFTASWVKAAKGVESYAVSGILGAISGGLLMIGATAVASQFVLFTILPPLVAAILGYSAVGAVFNWQRYGTGSRRGVTIQTNTGLRTGLAYLGAILIFVLTAHALNVMRFIIIGRSAIADYMTISASIGVVLGGIACLPAGVHAVFPAGDVVYNIARTILNALRSIEPLIMGLVFVIWVGIGPFAGVLALTLHSIASLGKLYSEQIENIDPGPIEALQATGATRLQTIIYAVVPQIVPPYLAFTLYRWDINVRMSTIIGFVGGGGIGFLLQQQIGNVQYQSAGVAVLAIGVVVAALDYTSATLRERWT